MESSDWAARTALVALISGMLLGAGALGAAIGAQHHRPSHRGAFCPAPPHSTENAAQPDSERVALPTEILEIVQLPRYASSLH